MDRKRIEKLAEAAVGAAPGGRYDCGRGCSLLRFDTAPRESFDALSAALEGEGFALYDSLTLPEAAFRTYEKDGFAVISFERGALRLIFDEFGEKYPNAPMEGGAARKTLWQFEVDHSLIDCGMCYAVRAGDGSFFMIDSPHLYSVNDDIRIVDFLKKLCGGGKPVVSGWFFSHGHEDHVGKFMDIVKYRSDEIDIRAVYWNFPDGDHPDSRFWDTSTKNITKSFEELMDEHPEIKRFRPHSGQTFYAPGLKFTVLCTHEDVFPASLRDYNDSSVSLMMEADGSKVLFPGDSSAESDRVLTPRWGSALGCDVVQVSHHGHSGLGTEFYRLAAADCALFPVTLIKYDEEWERQEANRTAAGLAYESHIASDGTVEIPLPYRRGGTVVWPDETFEDFDGIYALWQYEYTDEYKAALLERFRERSVPRPLN